MTIIDKISQWDNTNKNIFILHLLSEKLQEIILNFDCERSLDLVCVSSSVVNN